MRCLLVLPHDAGALGPAIDALVFDLGDADMAGDRGARRRATFERLHGHGLLRRGKTGTRPEAGSPATIVRLAPLSSGMIDADIDAVLPGAPDAVLLPGAGGGADLQHLAAKLAVAEAEHGLAAGRTGIVAAPAATAAGVLALGTLAGATPRLRGLLWDPTPLSRALGIGIDTSPVRSARDLLVLAASACGVPALDGGPEPEGTVHREGFAGRLVRRS